MHQIESDTGGEALALIPVDLVDKLIEQLTKEHATAAKLLGETKRKREALLADDLAALETITANEAALAQEFEIEEGKRLELMAKIAQKLAMDHGSDPGATFTLGDLVPLTLGLRRERLLDEGRKLKETMLALQETNSLNAELLRYSMIVTNYCLSLATGDGGQMIYGQPGKKEQRGYQKGSLDARA